MSQKGESRASNKPPMSNGSNPNSGSKQAPLNNGDKPLQGLLKGFRLSQYYRKMSDFGYEKDVYMLGLMNSKEREDMMS